MSTTRPVTLRPAELRDSRFVYDLAMLPTVRAASTRSDSFTFQEHERWYARRVRDSLIHIAEVDGVAVGYVRWGKVEDRDECEVAIAMRPEHHGRGYGLAALLASEPLCRERFGQRVMLVALVLVANLPSQRLFAAAGYAPVSREARMGKDHVRFEKTQ